MFGLHELAVVVLRDRASASNLLAARAVLELELGVGVARRFLQTQVEQAPSVALDDALIERLEALGRQRRSVSCNASLQRVQPYGNTVGSSANPRSITLLDRISAPTGAPPLRASPTERDRMTALTPNKPKTRARRVSEMKRPTPGIPRVYIHKTREPRAVWCRALERFFRDSGLCGRSSGGSRRRRAG